MFNRFMQRFNRQISDNLTLTKDSIAEMLRVEPDALDKFEKAYAKHALNQEPEDFFSTNSRQAAKANHIVDISDKSLNDTDIDIESLQQRIVDELLSQTEVYIFDGKQVKIKNPVTLSDGTKFVENEDINQLPVAVRPQLTGNLMKKDINTPSYPHLLWLYKEYLHGNNQKKREQAYHMFRQGLDILDLDEVTYEIIGTNPNSMGHWFPQLVEACSGQGFFKIPATTIAKVPLTLLQLTRQEYQQMTQTTLNIVDQWAYKTFQLDKSKEYFIKTGTYSSKFDFRNAHVHGEKEVEELGEYLLFIHYQALQMASPLSKPCIYGVSTTNEWVVREFIHDKENNPCIYKGLPLHTEYRVFVDCETDQVIGISPYWEPETMKKRFGYEEDANNPHQIHDYVIYRTHEETLMKRYQENKDIVVENLKAFLPKLNLKGQWSIDIMQNGEEFWIIDMALAENSAFYECVPKELRNPSKENWISEITEKMKE